MVLIRSKKELLITLAWMLVATACCCIVLLVLLMTMAKAAHAVPCSNHPDSKRAAGERTIEANSNHRWRWRTVDGRKCWYWSSQVLPHWELVWTYTEEEFNSDIERVIERKFYRPELDENGLLMERK